jgi:hypothetical protein
MKMKHLFEIFRNILFVENGIFKKINKNSTETQKTWVLNYGR